MRGRGAHPLTPTPRAIATRAKRARKPSAGFAMRTIRSASNAVNAALNASRAPNPQAFTSDQYTTEASQLCTIHDGSWGVNR